MIKTTILVISLVAIGVAQAPQGSIASRQRGNVNRPDCSAEAEKSFSDGYDAGWGLAKEEFTTQISDAASPLKISLDVEDQIDGASSYRFAAAEVVRSFFSRSLAVEPDAPLRLYIGGTKESPTGAQDISVELVIYTSHRFSAGRVTRLHAGKFVFANKGAMFAGYTQEKRTQGVREMVHEVISEFLKNWQAAAR